MFDAWAHEGDPLRRSFLETLSRASRGKRWVEEQRWSERREELARRRRVEHTHPVSKIERPAIIAGVVAALFAIFVPLGAALVDAGLAANESWAFWTGVTLYVAWSCSSLVARRGCSAADPGQRAERCSRCLRWSP